MAAETGQQIFNKVTERGLTIRMTDHFCDHRVTPGTNLSVEPLKEIQASNHQLPSPSFVPEAMIPILLSCQGGYWVGGIPDKTSGGVGV